MLEAAKLQDKEGKITYIQADLANLLDIKLKFDIIAVTFLLQYADSEEKLCAFLQNIWNLGKSGARVVGLNANMHSTPS